ncbi:FAD-dependent oxidoreductase [Nonomuraea endophytica]|uniref:FAD-dependent oxidoreductase n=1 Tax=Nonomuraea endophytica TaxID=714136 RepID=UPI0037C7D1C4
MAGSQEVAIVGAGLAGCLLACYLARRGHQVTLYERRPDPRAAGAERGRSINLALSERGLSALRGIGLEEQVMAEALPMRGRMIHPVRGELDLQLYSSDGLRSINSISRARLNAALLDAAEQHAEVRFEHRLTGLDPVTGTMRFADGQEEKAAVVLGADGAGSAVRARLAEHAGLRERTDFLGHGYKELTIPARDGEFAMDPGALHIWPRGTSMMIALPNPDHSFTCTLFWPDEDFDALASPEAVARHFGEVYPDAVPLIPDLVDDFAANPVGRLGTVRAVPWQAGGRVGLIGDAAHAIVPFYGQGANCAFEDVVVLDRCLDETGDDWSRALPSFERQRRADTEAIAEMALANFVEMRDKVASPVYRLARRAEHALQEALPGRYVSRYELISFSTVPYARVRRRVRRQQQVLGTLAALGALGAAALVFGAVRRLRAQGRPTLM